MEILLPGGVKEVEIKAESANAGEVYCRGVYCYWNQRKSMGVAVWHAKSRRKRERGSIHTRRVKNINMCDAVTASLFFARMLASITNRALLLSGIFAGPASFLSMSSLPPADVGKPRACEHSTWFDFRTAGKLFVRRVAGKYVGKAAAASRRQTFFSKIVFRAWLFRLCRCLAPACTTILFDRAFLCFVDCGARCRMLYASVLFF